MRPHSVSVWPAAAPAGAVEAAVLGAVDDAGGAAEAVLPEGVPDPQAARTSVAMATVRTERFMRPIVWQFAGTAVPGRSHWLVVSSHGGAGS